MSWEIRRNTNQIFKVTVNNPKDDELLIIILFHKFILFDKFIYNGSILGYP